MYIALVDFPTSDRAAALDILLPEAAAARAFAGNIDYRVTADGDDPERIVLLHRWQSKADFERYMASDLFARMSPKLRAMMTSAPLSLRMMVELDETVTL